MAFDLAQALLLQKMRRDEYMTRVDPHKPHCRECFRPTASGETICAQCTQINAHRVRVPGRTR